MKIHEPTYKKPKNGIITQSTYLLESYKVCSATLNGFLIIWSNRIYNTGGFESNLQLPKSNNKQYIKSIKVCEYSINTICGVSG